MRCLQVDEESKANTESLFKASRQGMRLSKELATPVHCYYRESRLLNVIAVICPCPSSSEGHNQGQNVLAHKECAVYDW